MRTAHWKQITALDRLAGNIMSLYQSEEARFRAAFAWTAQNIKYDLAALSNNKSYTYQELVSNTFRTKMALCEGYVAVLDSLNRLMGIKSYKVPGYTIWQGKLQPEPHLWLAVSINGKWHLSDPTWASGTIINGRYRADYDTSWLLTPPERMIRSHMPYDPIWQLLSNPLSHKGFIKREGDFLPGEWHISDSIAAFFQSSPIQQYLAELRRLRQGFSHQAIQMRINFLEESLRVQQHNEVVEWMRQSNAMFNAAVEAYNEAVQLFNERKPRKEVLVFLIRADQLLQSAASMLHDREVPRSLADELRMMQRQYRALEARLREAESNWY